MTPKTVTPKTSTIGKKTVLFAPKTTPSTSIKTVTPVQKLTPTVATTDVQDYDVVIMTEDNEVTLMEDEIGNLFQDTYSQELVTELLLENLQALPEEPPILQEPANIMYIQICDQIDANILVKISGINVIALYDTSTSMSSMAHSCYLKLEIPTFIKCGIHHVSTFSYWLSFMPCRTNML